MESPLQFCSVHILDYQLEIGPLFKEKKWRGVSPGKHILKVKMLQPILLKTMKMGPILSSPPAFRTATLKRMKMLLKRCPSSATTFDRGFLSNKSHASIYIPTMFNLLNQIPNNEGKNLH